MSDTPKVLSEPLSEAELDTILRIHRSRLHNPDDVSRLIAELREARAYASESPLRKEYDTEHDGQYNYLQWLELLLLEARAERDRLQGEVDKWKTCTAKEQTRAIDRASKYDTLRELVGRLLTHIGPTAGIEIGNAKRLCELADELRAHIGKEPDAKRA